MDDAEFLKVAFRPWELRKGMSSDLLFAHVFPKDSEDSDGDALLGSKMPPVPPWAEEAVKERQRPPEA